MLRNNLNLWMFSGLMLALFLMTNGVNASDRSGSVDFSSLAPDDIVVGEMLVKFAPGVTLAERDSVHVMAGAEVEHTFKTIPWQVVKVEPSVSLQVAADIYSSDSRVLKVEPNYRIYADETRPNDARYDELWGMERINAPDAWDTTTGSTNIVVAVIDTGVLKSHEDLAANIWTNPGESGDDGNGGDKSNNGIDDDDNGYIDDVHGWDFVDNDNDSSGSMHGSHCAGTIGGVGDNGIGVAGVNWNVKIVGVKFLGESGGTTAGAIKSVEYCTGLSQYIKLSNNSWGGGGFSAALKDAIDESGAAGQLFVAAAGNSTDNNDEVPHYPSSYDCSNIISVASITEAGIMSSFSCYGFESVDIAAPGSDILSCDVTSDSAYKSISGTSMATPHVTGAAALLWSVNPDATWQEIMDAILSSAAPNDALKGKVVTESELDVGAAMKLMGASISLNRLAYRSNAEVEISVDDFSVSNGVDLVDVVWETSYTTNDVSWWEIGSDSGVVVRASGTVECQRVVGETVFVGTVQLVSSTNMAVHGDLLSCVYGEGEDAVSKLAPIDDVAPVITNVYFDLISDDSTTIMWNTDESSDSYALIGEAVPLDQSGWTGVESFDEWMTTQTVYKHSIAFSDLDPETRYATVVRSTDPAGNIATYPIDVESTNMDDYVVVATKKRVILYEDDMESGVARWTHGGLEDVWEHGRPVVGPSQVSSGNNCWGTDLDDMYPNVMNAWLVSEPIAVRSNPRVKFASWVSRRGGDVAYFEVNGGRGWIPVAEIVRSGWSSLRQNVFDLKEEDGLWNTTIQIRFRLQSNGVGVSQGWYIDDVEVSDTPGEVLVVKEFVLPVDDAPMSGYANDGDGWPEPGENVQLNFTILSLLNRTVTGVTATVDCPSDGVDIDLDDRTLDYGDVSYAELVTSSGGVGVSLTNDATLLSEPIPFFISFSDESGDSWQDIIYVGLAVRGSAYGQVTNLLGAPIAGASVFGSAPGQPDISAITQADGSYELTGLAFDVVYQIYAVKGGDYSPSELRDVSLPAVDVDFGLGRAFANVTPASVALTLGQDDYKMVDLTVVNDNALSDIDLRFVADEDISRAGIYAGLSSGASEVSVAAGTSTVITLMVNSFDASVGVVSGNVYIRGNDVNSDEIVVPVELTIEPGPVLSPVTVTISDDLLGDGDGFAEPNEWMNLSTFVMNRGSGDAVSLTGTVAFVGTSGATILDSELDFGTVVAGTTTQVVDGSIFINAGVTNGMVLPFEMTLGDATGNSWIVPFEIEVQAMYAVVGLVTDATTGLPLEDIPVNVFGTGDSLPAKSDASGSYVLHGLGPGDYRVFVGGVSGYGAPPPADITIVNGDVSVDFALPPIALIFAPTSFPVSIKEGRELEDSFEVTNDGIADVGIRVQGVAVEGIVPESRPMAEGLLADWSTLSTNDYFPGHLVVRYKQGADMDVAASLLASVGAEQVASLKAMPIALLKINADNDISVAAVALSDSAQIQYVEPHYRYQLFDNPSRLMPDDTSFGELWGLHNIGQDFGTADKDIDAPEAWNITQGSTNVIIAICDTGIELDHDDLVDNLWVNPGESGFDTNGIDKAFNNIDDDGNGYTDDVHGVNFAWEVFGYSNSVPNDDHGHGTHVAGTVGAVGNNSNGVVGVNWNCQLMALKIGGSYGVSAFAAAEAIEYAIEAGARVSNHSWGGPVASAAMTDAIQYALTNNHLVVCAAGNSGADNNVTPSFPCNDPSENVISVAATDRDGRLASFSNYGADSVDIAAPGVDIFSTVPSNYIGHTESRYGVMSGTSMACPQVVGVVGLLLAYAPDASWDMIKTALMRGVVKDASLEGKMTTGGHLNAYLALRQLGSLWMEFEPDQFNLTPSASQTVNATFNAGGLLPMGVYRSDIVLESGITVSNRIPVTLTVTPGPVPHIDSVRVDDTVGGDGDGYAEPGETIDLYVSLYNSGTYNQPVAVGVLATSDAGVTLNSTAQSWGMIESDDTRESLVASSVTFGGGVTSLVSFTLDVDDGVNGVWENLAFELPVVDVYGITVM